MFTEEMISKNMEQINQDNERLLAEASLIDFQFMKDGRINFCKHTVSERGLFFITQAIERHRSRYGYSLVVYKNAASKVIIQCPIHEPFHQSPSNHLRGNDCPKCMGVHVPTTEQWVAKARVIHGDRFDYSQVAYKGTRTPVIIRCQVHGDFLQAPADHLKTSGCSACSGKRQLTTDGFIQKAKELHGDKYQYHLVQYKNTREKLEIVCPKHGSFFQSSNHHLKGHQCPECAKMCANDKLRCTTEEFIEKARNIHGEKYDYSSVQYKNSKEKIEIFCPIHGSFFQDPNSHLRGSGCPKCAGHNHDILYLLKCLETGWYKIGITTNSTKRRMSDLGGNLEEIHHVVLEDPRKHESILHKLYAKEREYNLCVRDGHTEFFSLAEEQIQEVIAYMNEVSSD